MPLCGWWRQGDNRRMALARIIPLLLMLGCSSDEGPKSPAQTSAEASGSNTALAAPEKKGLFEAVPEVPFLDYELIRTGFIDFEPLTRHSGESDDPIPLDFDILGAWDFDETRDDPFPELVMALQGKKVLMRGFMLPDVDFEHITKFHLVRSLWGCCFGAPPRMNELIRVTTPDEEGMDYDYNPLEVVGTLEIVFEMEDGILEDLYRLRAESIRVIPDFEDPDAPDGFDPSTVF